MSVREYTGARYVPLFIGEWDNTKSYEPLSIVQYQGNSYTSRQYVPIGIEITNEIYWANTGNYNAQIEAYRNEVLNYAHQVDGIEEQIEYLKNITENEMQIHMLYGNHSLTLVQTAEKNIVIDMAVPADSDRVIALFDQFGVSHIDYLIISHFHGDHCSGYETVLQYCNENTRVFRSMLLTDTNNDNYADYLRFVNEITLALANIGVTMEIPSNGQKVLISSDLDPNCYLQFWNTNQDYEEEYINSWKETGDTILTEPVASYNNYSLITRVQNNQSSYVDCGDVETEAQLLNAKNMVPANVVKYPHHNINRMGVFEFFDALAPDMFVFNIYNNQLGAHELTESGVQVGYLYRYINQCRYADVYNNYKQAVNITMLDGGYTNITGYFINMRSGSKDFKFRPTVRGVFPPAIQHYDNPNQLYFLTLADMAGFTKYIRIPNIFITSSSPFYGDSEFMKDARTIFGVAEPNLLDCVIENTEGCIIVRRTLSTGRKYYAEVYTTFVRDDWPETGARLISTTTTRTKASYTFPDGLPRDTVDATGHLVNVHGVSQNLFQNDTILAVCSDNNNAGTVYVPLTRCTNTTFCGAASNVAGLSDQEMYFVTIAGYKVYNCYSFNPNTNTFTQRKIMELRNTALN